MTEKTQKPYSIPPSGLTYLLRSCPACFHRQVTRQWRRPYSPMATVYGRIDGCMKDAYHGVRTSAVDASLKSGTILAYDESSGKKKEWYVKSGLLTTKAGHQFQLGGKPDALIEFDDGTWGVIDFKTSDPTEKEGDGIKEGYVESYSPQLDSYLIALEMPSVGRMKKVSWLGLITMTPDSLALEGTAQSLMGSTPERMLVALRVLELPTSEDREMSLLGMIRKLLDEPPADNPACRYCTLRQAEQAGLSAPQPPSIVETLLAK